MPNYSYLLVENKKFNGWIYAWFISDFWKKLNVPAQNGYIKTLIHKDLVVSVCFLSNKWQYKFFTDSLNICFSYEGGLINVSTVILPSMR